MKLAADFRGLARDALRGRWKTAVLAGFLAGALFYHLPGLFEFYELYRVFLPLFRQHRGIFLRLVRDRLPFTVRRETLPVGRRTLLRLGLSASRGLRPLGTCWRLLSAREYGVSARLTFSNSLLREEHLSDRKCNELCSCLRRRAARPTASSFHSDLLLHYLEKRYPGLYFVSSTTKVLTEFQQLRQELEREEFRYVVSDFRLNKAFDHLETLPAPLKDKVEFLCNECCWFGCKDRKACYETVVQPEKSGRGTGPEHRCAAPDAEGGYRFSKAI